ncbi:hypothetical protein F5Y06DRAFT_296132 [Hypoxylon sp. FL0890]|nr:hypothetical protein F5Y06DRAFT_296132 [Hypoxylon sp. FL0890]
MQAHQQQTALLLRIMMPRIRSSHLGLRVAKKSLQSREPHCMMTRRRLQQSRHHNQSQITESYQNQLTREVGTQFEGTTMDTADMSSALEELPDNNQTVSPFLRAVLGRTVATDDAQKSLLESDVVASLSPAHRK